MSAHAVFYKKIISKNSFFYWFCVVCALIVAINIMYSQKYNAYMYGVMEGQNASIIPYLKHIWGTSLFNLEIENYKTEGRSDVLNQWSQVQQVNSKRIQSLEEAARLYPYSPEIYFNLSLLYKESGNSIKAKEYLLKAQQIDPLIK